SFRWPFRATMAAEPAGDWEAHPCDPQFYGPIHDTLPRRCCPIKLRGETAPLPLKSLALPLNERSPPHEPTASRLATQPTGGLDEFSQPPRRTARRGSGDRLVGSAGRGEKRYAGKDRNTWS